MSRLVFLLAHLQTPSRLFPYATPIWWAGLLVLSRCADSLRSSGGAHSVAAIVATPSWVSCTPGMCRTLVGLNLWANATSCLNSCMTCAGLRCCVRDWCRYRVGRGTSGTSIDVCTVVPPHANALYHLVPPCTTRDLTQQMQANGWYRLVQTGTTVGWFGGTKAPKCRA